MVRHSDIVAVTESYIEFMKSVGIENAVLFEHHSDVIGSELEQEKFNSEEFVTAANNLSNYIVVAKKNCKNNV